MSEDRATWVAKMRQVHLNMRRRVCSTAILFASMAYPSAATVVYCLCSDPKLRHGFAPWIFGSFVAAFIAMPLLYLRSSMRAVRRCERDLDGYIELWGDGRDGRA